MAELPQVIDTGEEAPPAAEEQVVESLSVILEVALNNPPPVKTAEARGPDSVIW